MQAYQYIDLCNFTFVITLSMYHVLF